VVSCQFSVEYNGKSEGAGGMRTEQGWERDATICHCILRYEELNASTHCNTNFKTEGGRR